MRRVLAAFLLLVAPVVGAQETKALTRGLADALYCKVNGTCTVQNFTITGTCTGCGGSGTVTSVDNGTIGSLFSSSWATTTTTPRLSLTFAAFGANTVLSNATGGSAVPTAFTMPSCSTSASALNWTAGTGFGCNSSITAATNANLTGPITSTGNTTSIASQTGTGTKFVVDTSPTIITPTIASFVNANHTHADAAGGGTLASAVGLPISTGVSGLGSGVATFLGTPSSANLLSALTTKTGTGNAVFSNTPNLDNAFTITTAGVVTKFEHASAIVDIYRSDANNSASFRLWTSRADASNYARTFFGSNGANFQVGTYSAGTGTLQGLELATGGVVGAIMSATTQAFTFKGTNTNDNAAAGWSGEFTNAQCPGPSTTATITVTIASPAVVTWTAHPFIGTAPRFDACPVVFTTTGALPTGITASTQYWIIPTTISGNNFSIATSVANAIAGTAVNTSGTQSGTHTGTAGSVLTTATAKDVTGLALTAGDWDCSAILARGLAGTTSVTLLKTSISGTSATDGTIPSGTMIQFAEAATVLGNDITENMGPVRVLNSGTANTFLVADDTFTVSTNKAYGTLRCRRVR